MEFFNPKTETVRFQFSSFGLKELSRGMFQPAFFVPMDDGVLYEDGETRQEFLERIRSFAFVKSNKQHHSLCEESAAVRSVAYRVREEKSGTLNTARSSIQIYVQGAEVLSAAEVDGVVNVDLDDVFVLRSGSIPLENIPNESNSDPLLVCESGEYFRFKNGHLLLDVAEFGVEGFSENFWCELYEVVDEEDVAVDLKNQLETSGTFTPSREVTSVVAPVDVLCDWEIPGEILCAAKSVRYAGDAQNVFVLDDGMVSDETTGKTCVITTSSAPTVYTKIEDGGVGNGCSGG